MGGFITKSYFNSRPSARGDDCDWAIQKWLERFQFTPLREGRRYPIKPPASDSLFQFTPLREGRLQVLAANNVIVPISIHAPPRGATATLREASLPTSFQFTPLREGRRNQRQDGGALEYFNSRPSARGDRNFFEGGDSLAVHFNSRPSARGDDSYRRHYRGVDEFQFTPLREGRHAQGNFIAEVIAFQFTPLREGRPTPPTAALSRRYFNSRPSARGDRYQLNRLQAPSSISIHAPPRGATTVICAIILLGDISIHAPPRGATRPASSADQHHQLFQFTPLREGRLHPRRRNDRRRKISIHAPPRGATFRRGNRCASRWHFNSRPSARGDNGHTYTVEYCLHFNSRPSARGDERPTGNYYGERSISIHAPPRGATSARYYRVFNPLFQFTPLREGRQDNGRVLEADALFQFTPLREGRLLIV